MELIVPAYNIKPALAAKFEEKIAKIMHRKRDEEINRFRADKLPPKKGRDPELVGAPKLPEQKLTGSAVGRANNATDELVLKLLANKELSILQIAEHIGMSRQAVRHAVERLVGRKEVRKKNAGFVTVFWAVGSVDDKT